MTILLVDDSEDSRDLTEAALRSGGYRNLRTASSAAAAFDYLGLGQMTRSPAPVEAILLDIVMPDIDGLEACGRIRTDARYRDVPIIMVTSLAETGSMAEAFAAGANDYIGKPVNRIELTARLGAALRTAAELTRRGRLLAQTP